MSDSLKDQVRKKVSETRLTEHQLDSLLGLQDSIAEQRAKGTDDAEEQNIEKSIGQSKEKGIGKSKEKRSRFMGRLITAPMAACFALLVVVGVVVIGMPHWVANRVEVADAVDKGEQQALMVAAIAEEVAKNHIKMKPLEVKSSALVDLQRYFDLLDFSPIRSGIAFTDKLLLGGRYCSIQGVTAAQLRYQTDESKSTLYEVVYDGAVFGKLPNIDHGEVPIEHYSRGVAVKIWVEKGLLLVLAQNVH